MVAVVDSRLSALFAGRKDSVDLRSFFKWNQPKSFFFPQTKRSCLIYLVRITKIHILQWHSCFYLQKMFCKWSLLASLMCVDTVCALMCGAIDLFWQAALHWCRVPHTQAEGRGLCRSSTRHYSQAQVQGETKGQALFYFFFSLSLMFYFMIVFAWSCF